MIEYSENLKFWLSLTDLINVGGISPDQHKKIVEIVLLNQPKIIIETGVCVGSSTVSILECLTQLNNGILYSIDNMSLVKKFTGCYVTEDLKKRWRFIEANSRDYLSSVGNDFIFDIFLHDSEHTFENMKFEYDFAFKHIKGGGYILSHDIHNNSAWDDFCNEIRSNIVESFKLDSLGGIKIVK